MQRTNTSCSEVHVSRSINVGIVSESSLSEKI